MKGKQVKLSEINQISRPADMIIKLVFTAVVGATCIYPLLMVIGSSLTDNMEILRHGYNIVPRVVSFEAYKYVLFKSGKLLRSYGVTILTTAVGTFLGVLMMSMYAYPISRKDLKYRKFFSLFAYVTFVFSGGLVPFYFVYSRLLDLTNNLWVMIMPYLVDVWYIVILRTFFAGAVPPDIIQAAKIDGAGELRIFFSIVTRMAIPGIATVALFTTLKYWNDFQLPLYFIEDSKKFNIQYMLYRIMANMEFLAQDTHSVRLSGILPVESARMAMCVLGTGPMLIAYPFFQKYFIKGLTMGAVKG